MVIQEHVPLHDKNWFGTGGAARYFAAPSSAQAFQEAVRFANEQALTIFVLGKGANILVSDSGVSGLVIQPQLQHITKNDTLVTAGAGVCMQELITWCLDHQLIGLEEFSGIPGTVGGSVYINLHYFEYLLADFLVHARVIERATGDIQTVDASWFHFGYNQSRLHDETHYLIDATFKLRTADEAAIAFARGRRHEMIRHRTKRYPNKGTCGSFFRNFHETEVHLELHGKKAIWVAYYLDKLGIKGALSVGGAMVSWQHANMLVNDGTATSADIITLARTIQEQMLNAYGIIPQPECRLIGFEQNALLCAQSAFQAIQAPKHSSLK